MAAKAQPTGNVPEKYVVDVNAEASSPSEEAKPEAPESAEAEVDEKDLEEVEEESRKIPYSRFKEVNEKAKSLETQLQEREQRFQEDLRREIELSEMRLRQQLKREQEQAAEDEVIDPVEKELRSVRKELSQIREENRNLRAETSSKLMQDQVSRLEKIYPKRVVLAALGLKKHDPKINLEEVCEEFEADAKERANQQLRAIIEKKKERAKSVIPTRESGIKLKESDRPKTM